MTAESYDYVIVGAGSAGCVLANRLSENPRTRVLLLEAGGTDRRFWIKVPLGYAFTFTDPRVNWCYSTAPDPGLNGRVGYWPRGRVLGGSSSINAMAYLRGLPHDFEDWRRAGALGWGWAEVQRIYDALETTVETGTDGAPRRRGNGPLRVSDLRHQMHPFARHFLTAAQQLDWPVIDDINAPGAEGLGMVRSTVRAGRRWSCADAFLRPAARRANLRIVTNAAVERIDLERGRATGVSYRQGERTIRAAAGAEVILSAGAINSPQLLQLSGIGPAPLLRRHGIGVQRDLPWVGEGLQDHLAITHYYRASEPTLNNALGTLPGRLMAGARYLLTRRGPLSIPVNHCSGFIRTGPGAPDVQVYCNPASYAITAGGQPAIDREPGFLLCIQPCRPTSTGSVTIASSDPREAPVIEPRSLSTPEDRDAAIRASRMLQALAGAPALRRVTRKALPPDIAGLDDEALLANFRERAMTVFHPTCSCRMGHDASDSVLDSQLRVHGVGGLRVVDASAFPNITSGNTNAPTIMLAAKAAEIILQQASAAREAAE